VRNLARPTRQKTRGTTIQPGSRLPFGGFVGARGSGLVGGLSLVSALAALCPAAGGWGQARFAWRLIAPSQERLKQVIC